MPVYEFILSHIKSKSQITIRTGHETIGFIPSSFEPRNKESLKVYKPTFIRGELLCDSLQFAILNSTKYLVNPSHNSVEIEVVL